MQHVHILCQDSERGEQIAATFRGDGWTTSLSDTVEGMAMMLRDWMTHQPYEPVGLVLVARTDDELAIDGTLYETATKERIPLVCEPVIAMGIMTSAIRECVLIGADIVVPFNAPPEKLLAPMRAAIEDRRQRRARSLAAGIEEEE